MPALSKEYQTLFKHDVIEKVTPHYIIDNLNPNLPLRYYQNEALQVFFHYFKKNKEQMPISLLFQMATGSGKTLVMAALILYLWKQGYRNFLFFVNSTNIIEKTKQNFLNKFSSKYLFSNQIIIEQKKVNIREVQNFDESNRDDINIVFVTVQGLHSLINNSRENSITIEDFKDKEIVLLSDEAHHINALTRLRRRQTGNLYGEDIDNFAGLSKGEAEHLRTWEGTVKSIFKQNRNNIMLEFTATIDLDNKNIKEKYENKIIYQYDLKQFREDGFSKNIELFQVNADLMHRAMSAVLLSQYRLKVAQKYKLNIKPVILFKSKTINESKQFVKDFKSTISNLTSDYLQQIKRIYEEKTDSDIFEKVFSFLEENKIDFENLVLELKEDFLEEKLLEINSKDESESKQIIANSLEDKDNMVRAIFVVDMLNEGWDVLNLFDIVRLYDTRDVKEGKPGKVTISEAQLIGRGARYCPFEWEDSNKFIRKFDFANSEQENELKVLEMLYYHSLFNSRYISELRTTLVSSGIMAKERHTKEIKVKDKFKDTEWWKYGVIYLNSREENSKRDIIDLKSIDEICNKRYEDRILTYEEKHADLDDRTVEMQEPVGMEKHSEVMLSSLGANVIRTALYSNDFYTFNNLKSYFHKLNSYSEFIKSEDFLGIIKLDLKNLENKDKIHLIPQDEKLRIAKNVIEDLKNDIEKNISEFEGTESFTPHLLRNKIKDKEIEFDPNKDSRDEVNCRAYDWAAQDVLFCTSEEKSFLDYFQNNLLAYFEKKYKSIFLIRNERFCKMYNFDNGVGFEPDFLLLLKKEEISIPTAYQIWIEPKGNQFKDNDGTFNESVEGWKERFLKKLREKAKIDNSIANRGVLKLEAEDITKKFNYIILGPPFYNQQLETAHNRVSEYFFSEALLDKECLNVNLFNKEK